MKHYLSEKGYYYQKIKNYDRFFDILSAVKPTVKGSSKLEHEISHKLLRLVGKVLKNSLVTFCVINTVFTVVGFPACIYGKSMQPEFNAPRIRKEREPAAWSSWRSSFPRLDLDWVWVSCWKARQFTFTRGDIVVFVSPKEPYDYVIKRVIALEGDTVRSHAHQPVRVRIPEGHCWVEGDNWDNSVDSNKYGPISKGLIFGVATHVIWPTHKWRELVATVPAALQPDRVEAADQQLLQQPAAHSRILIRKMKVLFYLLRDLAG